MTRLLMCRPDHYGIYYVINPWMDRRRQADRDIALRQWEALYQLLTDTLRVQVELLPSVPGLPDLCFTANAGLLVHNLFVSSRFRYAEREAEVPHFTRWFLERNYRVVCLPQPAFFEGEGDALFCGDVLFAGYRFRSELQAHRLLEELIELPVHSLELSDPWFYHLDTCLCLLQPGQAAYYPEAFSPASQRLLKETIPELFPVTEAEARRFACNALVVEKAVVMNADCPHLSRTFAEAGYQVHQIETTEFLKAGGGPKCLALFLDRDAT
ncbi:MAG: amidinotransferase [candidate division NC10 bacterium]|nr:amidinotransferase [candidate division NC10 bacterium]MDE2322497.1 amidinotransferase [candidate division NC10 bacterium]